MPIITDIRSTFDLKGVGVPECHLGGNFHTVQDSVPGVIEANDTSPDHHLSEKWLKEDVSMAFSAKTHIKNSLERIERMIGHELATKNTPMSESWHPELDDSPMLNSEEHTKFRSMIGCANWLVTLGRFDIAYSVNTLSRFSQAPRKGHLEGIKRVFGCLKKFDSGRIIIDPKCPDHNQFDSAVHDQ